MKSVTPPMEQVLATSYPTRLAALESVGRRYPGLDRNESATDDNVLLEQVGVFAGAYLQTKWQDQTGRGTNPWWSALNYSLTIIPYEVAASYESQRPSILGVHRVPTLMSTGMAAESITETHVRQAWMTYFEINDRQHLLACTGSNVGKQINDDSLPSSQLAYWVAHVLSLKYAEYHYKAEFEKKPAPPLEAEFREAWWMMVELMDDVGVSTKAGLNETVQSLAMPEHLLSNPDAVTRLPFTQEAFVRLLIATRRATQMIKRLRD